MRKKWTPTEIAAVIGAVVLAGGGVVAAVVQRGGGSAPQQKGTEQLVPAPKQPLLSLPVALDTLFFPSGWMGDGRLGTKHVTLRGEAAQVDDRTAAATMIAYTPGPDGWAGIYWQYPDRNWGDTPGRALSGARAITFFARGANGGEVAEFKAGGIHGPKYSDSFEKSLGKVTLQKTWRPLTLDLSQSDLTSVIGAFAVVIASSDNRSTPITVWVADLALK